jgi:hypothetical protein
MKRRFSLPVATPSCYTGSTEDVKHPRLTKRGNLYWFRAKLLADLLQHFRPKRERTYSLRTSDVRGALEKVRVASVRFDQEMLEVRRKLATAPLLTITDAEVERLAGIYLSNVLEEDEETRRDGLAGDHVFAAVKRQVVEAGGTTRFSDPQTRRDTGLTGGLGPKGFTRCRGTGAAGHWCFTRYRGTGAEG